MEDDGINVWAEDEMLARLSNQYYSCI